jgi:hypothetical protein
VFITPPFGAAFYFNIDFTQQMYIILRMENEATIYGTGSVKSRKKPFDLEYGQTGDFLSPLSHKLLLFRPHGRTDAVSLSPDEVAFGWDVPFILETK